MPRANERIVRRHVDPSTGWPFEVIERGDGTAGAYILTDPATGLRYRRKVPDAGARVTIAEWVGLVKLGTEALTRRSDPDLRRAARVLSMVHELHKLGFQRLRIVPGMAPSGAAWRCTITHRGNILRSHGALAGVWQHDAPTYSSAMGNEYFGWSDAHRDTARVLAHKFLGRFPDHASPGRGEDFEYAGWFCTVLAAAERGVLPVAYDDDWGLEAPRRLATTGDVWLPLPPGGDADL